MAVTYELEIVTPEGRAYRGRVQSLKLPGLDGSFGVLARHAPMLAGLAIGVLEVTGESVPSDRFAVGEGFVEVGAELTRVLTDFCDASGDIDVARARQSEERARERLKARAENVDRVRAEASLRRALVRLKVQPRV